MIRPANVVGFLAWWAGYAVLIAYNWKIGLAFFLIETGNRWRWQ